MNRLDLIQVGGKYPPPQGESDILGVEGNSITILDETYMYMFCETLIVFASDSTGYLLLYCVYILYYSPVCTVGIISFFLRMQSLVRWLR